MHCASWRGPAFIGGGSYELAAFKRPFNGENNCFSCAKSPGYKIGMETDGVTNKLTRKKDDKFTITELEVWSLKHK
jgi:hypothetical protein